MNNIELETIVMAEFLSLASGKELRRFCSILKTDYFTNPFYKNILVKAIALIKENKKPSIYYLKTMFPENLEEYRSLEKFSAIPVITTSGLQAHIEQLAQEYACIKASHLFELCLNKFKEEDKLKTLTETIKKLRKIKEDTLQFDLMSTEDKVKNTLMEYQQIKLGKYQSVVPYCIPTLDKYIFLTKGQVHVIAGSSGSGKTAFALSTILNQLKANLKVVLFCCETRHQELFNRMACILSNARYIDILKGFSTSPELEEKYLKALDLLGSLSKNLIVYGIMDYEHSVSGIENKLIELTRNDEQYDMVYIDYLQSLKNCSKQSERYLQIEDDMKEICRLASEYNVAVTLLCQFNRTRHMDEKADVHHLKGSSSIENFAHLVSFLTCTEKDIQPDMNYVNFELASGKCRLQAPFTINLIRTSSGEFQVVKTLRNLL